MTSGATGIEALDHSERVESILAIVREILAGTGIGDVTPDSVIWAPRFYDGPVLVKDTDLLNRFLGQFALKARFVGYAANDVAFLTVRQFCEMYLRESYPPTPKRPLSDAQYAIAVDPEPLEPGAGAKDFPICFVLGCGRSGTTLFRTMLNTHENLWAPGELHMATFEGMADRAENISPILRYMPIPEIASRLGEPNELASKKFRNWELENRSISEVYENLHHADPTTLIVDKTPTYSGQLRVLKRIGDRFPNAKFVHLIRSPHDVIRSLVRMQLYKGAQRQFEPGLNPYQIGEATWFLHNSNIEAFLGDIPDERKCRVRYEELVSDAKKPLMSVCELLDRPYDSKMEDPYRERSGRVALGAGDMQVNFLQTVEHRAPSEAFYPIGAKCRNLAKRYGYDMG